MKKKKKKKKHGQIWRGVNKGELLIVCFENLLGKAQTFFNVHICCL